MLGSALRRAVLPTASTGRRLTAGLLEAMAPKRSRGKADGGARVHAEEGEGATAGGPGSTRTPAQKRTRARASSRVGGTESLTVLETEVEEGGGVKVDSIETIRDQGVPRVEEGAPGDVGKEPPAVKEELAVGGKKPVGAAKKARATKGVAPASPTYPVYDPSRDRPARLSTSTFNVCTWNVAGLRALQGKDAGAVRRLIEEESLDVLCLQETKLQAQHVPDVQKSLNLPAGWHCLWTCSGEKKGYSGVALLSKTKPLSHQVGLRDPRHDIEGRVITAEFPEAFVVSTYVPNSGDGLKRLDYRTTKWDKALARHLRGLRNRAEGTADAGKEPPAESGTAAHPGTKGVILAGDLNVAHREIDIHSPKTNLRSAGFTIEERQSFEARLIGGAEVGGDEGDRDVADGGDGETTPSAAGLVDVFRLQHPETTAYSYWGYRFNLRAKNKGWRLDYTLCSPNLVDRVHDAYHLPNVMGSDHCPVGVQVRKV